MGYKDYIDFEKFPSPWCPGCSIGLILKQAATVLDELKYDVEKNVFVSGIGCTGRISGFFNADSIHGMHGRAIPIAEGVKRANPDLNVVVISGDGDLLGIGGNHLLHAARRDTDLTVICFNNRIYGMTGGQLSPMTEKDKRTKTSPDGNEFEPLNVQGLLAANKRFYYARTTASHFDHMFKCIKDGMQHKGFSFIEVRGYCFTNYGRKAGFKNINDQLVDLKTTYKLNKEPNGRLEDFEIGIIKR